MGVNVFPSLWPTLCEAATGNRWPPSTIEEGVAFVRRAMDEQLLPLLYEEKSLPDPVSRALATVRAAYLAHVARSAVIREHLRKVGKILTTSGVEFIVLKGCDFGSRLYPQPHLRPVVDIDILVREGEMERTADVLVSAGFARFFPGTLSTRVSSHHETALGISNVVVDLHQRFLQKQRHRIDYDAIWKRAQPFEGEGFQAMRLSDADAAAYLTLSVTTKYFRGVVIRYVDLWLLLSSNGRCLDEAADLAKEWSSRRAFYATLRYGARMFPELESSFERAMKRVLGPMTRQWLDKWVVPDKMLGRGGSRAEQLWRKYWLIDNAMLRTHSAAEHAVATVRGYFRVVPASRRPFRPPEGRRDAGTTRRLKVVLFGSGSPMSVAAFRSLAGVADILRVVGPRRRMRAREFLRRLLGRTNENPLMMAAVQSGVPFSRFEDAERVISSDAPDLICVATFPHLIPEKVLSYAKLGAMNLHTSLLPRHRGSDPLFWTYFEDEKETGVTLHWMKADIDTGDIIAQRRWTLETGARAIDVYYRQTDEGCAMLVDAVKTLSRGDTLTSQPQDPRQATYDPSPGKRTWKIDFGQWPVHRVWHFLNGLSALHDDLLTNIHIAPDLKLIERTHDQIPGTLIVERGSFRLFCNGGVIEGWTIPRLTALRRRVARWLA